MIQLIFSTILLLSANFATLDAHPDTDQDTKILKRLDDGQPLVEPPGN
ncbi:MAG: hypothetical protein R8G66_02570 [Cytophagales bacterium]|nr:hypothetical protein [Cytophagales bacterium]